MPQRLRRRLTRIAQFRPYLLFLAALVSGAGSGCMRFAVPVPAPGQVSVYFSPDGGATEALVREIDAAQRHILVQAYGFTSAPIAKALTDAHQRGVDVRVVLDKSNETAQYTGATFLLNAGIPVLIDARHAIAHNKVMVIDGATVVTGSFNFTKAAEARNAENLLILKDNPELVQRYTKNFSVHAEHATPYRRDPHARDRERRSAQGPHIAKESSGQPPRAPARNHTGRVRANLKSKVYHLPGCPGYERLKPEQLVAFGSEQDARRAGYRKADNCPSATAY